VPPRRPISGATVGLPAPGVTRRLRELPDSIWLDRLLRSRLWIWIIGLGLGGIVAMQVSLLKLNTGISRAVQASSTLERSNAQLEEQVATLSTGERVRDAAAQLGLVMPAAGSVGYLTVRPGFDVKRALGRMTPPSPQALELLAAGGRVAPLVTAAPAVTTATTATTAAAPAVTPVPQPAATATPAPAAAATPAPPATTQAPPPTAAGVTGAAAAPSGQG
jgi:cell division protein FtsB